MSGAAFSHLAVVLLGAGASTRMGRPKLLLPWEGTTVVGHLVRQWREWGVGRITVVLRPGDEALERELDGLGIPAGDRIFNPAASEGMFSSIRCAARWEGWRPETSSWLVALGDQPHLRGGTLGGLLEFHRSRPGTVCQPSFEGRPRHPVILPREAWARLAETAAPTLRDFLKSGTETSSRALWPCADAGLSLDLDTPDDYRRIAGLAGFPSVSFPVPQPSSIASAVPPPQDLAR